MGEPIPARFPLEARERRKSRIDCWLPTYVLGSAVNVVMMIAVLAERRTC